MDVEVFNPGDDFEEASTSTTTPFKVKTKCADPESPILNRLGQRFFEKGPEAKRLKLNNTFINPWRCESPAYNPLPITHHSPVYHPACYFAEAKRDYLTDREKTLRIMAYHDELHAQFTQYQQEHNSIPLGDPIQGTPLFNGVVERRKNHSSSENQEDDNTYISRSGRHVKRRVDLIAYAVSDDEDKEKAEKATAKRFKREDSPPAKATPPQVKRETIKLNDEIDLSPAPNPNKKLGRTALIMKEFAKHQEEQEKAAKQRSLFEETLEVLSDDDMEDITSSLNPVKEETEENFIKRRVVPPSAMQRRAKHQTTSYEVASTSTVPSTSHGTNNKGEKNDKESFGGALKNASTTNTNGTGAKRGGKKKMPVCCPICNENFASKDIEQHASTCGLTSELEIESSIPNQRTDHPSY